MKRAVKKRVTKRPAKKKSRALRKKFDRCVREVKAKDKKGEYNPYAVCESSIMHTRKNPSKPLIVASLFKGKVFYYDGENLNSVRKKAQEFKTFKAAASMSNRIEHLKDITTRVFSIHDNSTDIKKELIYQSEPLKKAYPNPIAGSRGRRITKAERLYEDFTGHKAEYMDEIEVHHHDVCLTIGKVTGIMYETVRDGRKEDYIHEFKKASQPLFCVSADGQQIYLIGGSYLFKDSGINDV